MANEGNLIPFDQRTEKEQREIAKKGGVASGESRRRKENFRKTLNMLLTSPAEINGMTDFLKANGLESTYESAINFAMIQMALNGDVKAYNAIRDTIGQTVKSDLDLREQEVRIKHTMAQVSKLQDDDKEQINYLGIPTTLIAV